MEDWILAVILALFVIVPCWLALSRRQEIRRQVEAWRELAKRTGLTFNPNVFDAPLSSDHRPGIRGEYRGRSIAITLLGDSERNDPPKTSIALNVQNCARFSLSIQAKSVREYLGKAAQLSSGNLVFDRSFSAAGSPCEYVQGAVDLIVRTDARLLKWIIRSFPCIELKGETLGFYQNGELTNVDDQLALLNLLCYLAELTENMESSEAEYSELEKE